LRDPLVRPPRIEVGDVSPPGANQLELADHQDKIQTSEYARDAAHLGLGQALILAGHAASEEPGTRWIIR